MASCIRNTFTKTYCNWITFLQVMMKTFWCIFMSHSVNSSAKKVDINNFVI